MSPGNVAREGIPFELFRSTYPGRHVARERYPQRQVARDTPDLSLGNIANVVVTLSSASACFHRLSRVFVSFRSFLSVFSGSFSCRRLHSVDFFLFERVIFGPYQLVHVKFEISSWHGARVDVRTYLLGGAIDSSEANGIIRDPKLELENSCFTFDLVPLSYESAVVVIGENWLLRHKAEMGENELKRIRGFTPRRRIRFRTGIRTRSDTDFRRLVSLTSLERQEVRNELPGVCKRSREERYVMDTLKFMAMRFWVNQCTSGFHGVNELGGVCVAREDDRGVTEGREDVRKVFQQCGSGVKRKLSRCGRNQIGNEPILALPKGADDFVVYYDARSKDLEACLEKKVEGDCLYVVTTEGSYEMLYRGVGRRSEAKNEFEIDVRRSDLEMESGSYWLDKVRTSIWRDVRTLAIEEAYTTKYSIHPGADTMLCGFRLTNRWLSMKKDIASCGSKYLAYSEEEVEYQGSSGLLLQPELPE
ncbi:hypothetical protein Tco_0569378 [Tanacetum coccineum]